MKRGGIRAVAGRLWQYLARHRVTLVACFVILILSNALSLAIPLLSGRAIDAIGTRAGAVDFPRVFLGCGLMLGCYLVSGNCSYLLSVVLLRLSQKVCYRLRGDIFDKFVRLPVSFCDRHPVGDIISCICYDVDTVGSSLSTDLMQIFTSVFTVVGSLVMLLILSPALSTVVLITIPVTTLFSRWQMRRMHPVFRRRAKLLGELGTMVEEGMSAQRAVSTYSCEEALIARFDPKNREAMDAYYQAEYRSCLMGPMVNFINNLSLALGSALGVVLCLSGRLSLGAVSAFILYSRKFSGPIREAANIVGEIQAAGAAAERVFRFIDEEPETPDAPQAAPLDRVRGEVALERISFSYEPDQEILKDLCIDIPSGSTIAIVGPTGAGKSTIVNLLMRFYDVDAGRITLDGVDIREAIRRDLRLSYAMVLQESWLFHGSIYDNIAYGNPSASHEQVVEAAKAANIHSFIQGLPQGYDTILTDDSANLSKGQKQLMTIARAMLIDASMLILDEATSNVDTATELAISQAMGRLMQGKTCFVIAHRLSTIQHADLILVMDNGRVVERGTHKELLDKRGVYYSLYCLQFQIL